MKCRHCGHTETSVLATRKVDGLAATRRIRACGQCGKTFDTYEIDGGIWKTVRKWAVENHDKALVNKQKLVQRNEEIARLIKSGTPYEQICEKYGLAKTSITAIARKMGLPKANANQRRANLRNEQVVQMVRDGVDYGEIAKKFSITRKTVVTAVRKAGLGPRKSKKATSVNPWGGLL